MNPSKPIHAHFPIAEIHRLTDGLDFTMTATDKSVADLFMALMSEAETAFQQHGWKVGINYDEAMIVQAATSMFPIFAKRRELCFNLGYQNGSVPDEDKKNWQEAVRKNKEALNQAEKWISVKERLPEKNQQIIICFVCPITEKQVIEVAKYRKDEDFYEAEAECIGSDLVTHWHALPKPPKE